MAARMPEPTHVWMHHEETGGDWECPVGLVEAYEQRGWVVSDGPRVTDQHLYDDPEDPRIVSAPQAPAPSKPSRTTRARTTTPTTPEEQ